MTKQKAIPDKMYFRIGETAEILDVKPYVLRYWETEFPDIKPVKSQSNQRLYKRKDVEMLLAIKHLLYDEKFTINGARDHLKESMKTQSKLSEPVAAKASAGKTEDLFEKVSAQSKEKSANSGKIFSKLKGELEWCLTELRK